MGKIKDLLKEVIEMKRKYLILSTIIALILLTTVGLAMGNKQVEQKAVIAGTVSSTVAEGTTVKMGDSLVEISTLTGTSAAARATVNGVVKKVLVKVGDNITPYQVGVYVEQHKIFSNDMVNVVIVYKFCISYASNNDNVRIKTRDARLCRNCSSRSTAG